MIIEEVKALNLPEGEYVVVGSGALSVRGIREHDDIDLQVSDELYEKLKADGWEEREKTEGHFHLYKGNVEVARNFLHIEKCDLDPRQVIDEADVIEGIPFMRLEHLVQLKKVMSREKDLKDIELIKNWKERK